MSEAQEPRTCLSVCLSVLSVCLFACMSVCLSVCLYIFNLLTLLPPNVAMPLRVYFGVFQEDGNMNKISVYQQ